MPDSTTLRIVVRVKGTKGFFFESRGPNPTVPRTGEFVEFADGVGKVESVTWKPPLTPNTRHVEMLLIVECVQVAGRKPLPMP
jgi:hypothetical protein